MYACPFERDNCVDMDPSNKTRNATQQMGFDHGTFLLDFFFFSPDAYHAYYRVVIQASAIIWQNSWYVMDTT